MNKKKLKQTMKDILVDEMKNKYCDACGETEEKCSGYKCWIS